jgi:hypothetical protein
MQDRDRTEHHAIGAERNDDPSGVAKYLREIGALR